jgi:hypothetical protein
MLLIFKREAAAAITTILIIGIIVAEIAIAAAVASYFATQAELGLKAVYQASFAAQSGIDDALLKIIRNKSFNPTPNPYTLSLGQATAQVRVCIDKKTTSSPCDTSAPGIYEITSLGTFLNKQSRLRAIVYVDSSTGLATVNSIAEISTSQP